MKESKPLFKINAQTMSQTEESTNNVITDFVLVKVGEREGVQEAIGL